jgi:hypothetical protein
MKLKTILTILLLTVSLSINALDKKTRLICKINDSKVEYEILLTLNNTAYVTALINAKGNTISSINTQERKYSLNDSPRKLTLNWEQSSGDLYLSKKIVIDRTSLDFSINHFIAKEMFTGRGQCEISNAILSKKL